MFHITIQFSLLGCNDVEKLLTVLRTLPMSSGVKFSDNFFYVTFQSPQPACTHVNTAYNYAKQHSSQVLKFMHTSTLCHG